jgi:hypothetical protein
VDQPCGKRLTPEEVGGVRLQERAQAFVRVADLANRYGHIRGALDRGPEGAGELERVGEAKVGLFRGRLRDHAVKRLGKPWADLSERRNRIAQVAVEQFLK